MDTSCFQLTIVICFPLFCLQLMSVANLDELFNFPFYNFLVFSTERHMAHLVSLDWFVWLFAIIILVLPLQWQKPAVFAMTGVSWIILMTCGAKMQSSVVHLAARYLGGDVRAHGWERGP